MELFEQTAGIPKRLQMFQSFRGTFVQSVLDGSLGWLVLGAQGLWASGSFRNRLDQDIGLARQVPHERPPNRPLREVSRQHKNVIGV